jgi:hypothetical protein
MVRADWAIVMGWQKLLLGLALCLPIPALSVSGLELQLPSAVYRVAVALVESTEGLAGAFNGRDEPASVRSAGTATVLTRAQPAEPSRRAPESVVHAKRARTPRHVERVAPTRARYVGATPVKRSRVAPPAAAQPARAPSAPATETTPATVAAAPTPTPSAAPEPVQRPAETSPIEPPAVKPPASTSPPAPPPPPPPPAVTPTPGLLDPVTKPLEPVTKPLEPVTDVLEPVTKPLGSVTGRLGTP